MNKGREPWTWVAMAAVAQERGDLLSEGEQALCWA